MVPDGGVNLMQGRSIRFHRESGASQLSSKCVICGQPLKKYDEFANGAALSLADAYVRIRFAIYLARIVKSRPCTL